MTADEADDPIVEAVTVLTSRGHTVEADDDYGSWRIDGGEWITAGDLLAWAILLGLNAGTGRMQ